MLSPSARLSAVPVVLAVAAVAMFLMLARRPDDLRVEFRHGGVVVVDGTARALPFWAPVGPDPRMRVRIVNRDSAWRSVGVVAVPAGDSALYELDQCLPAGAPRDRVLLR